MTFPINTNIPNGPNDPADDQVEIRTNFSNINSYLQVDHVEAGAIGNGEHLQVTYNSFNPPSAPSDSVGIAFTDAGIARPASPMNYYINSQGTFPMTALRAFGVFTTQNIDGAVVAGNGFNIVSITASASGQTYTIVLTTNSVNSDDVAIMVSTSFVAAGSFQNIAYSFTGSTLTITGVNQPSAKLSFFVYQI